MKILLGLSGGVDSTYAALALKNAGHEVAAAMLIMHGGMDPSDARESAASLGIPLYEIDCRESFEKTVVKNFSDEYICARTPNPCVVCNSEVKFIELLRAAENMGFDAIATGHYARVIKLGDRYAVARGKDTKKDQTYMLWRLPQSVLRKLVLPLSDVTKEEIRAASADAGLSASERADSQEICFISDGDYASFVERERGTCPQGDFIDESGKVIGKHNGIIRYTVGQRKGLGISAPTRLFVTKIDAKNNTVTLSANDPHAKVVRVSGIVYSGLERPKSRETYRLSVKLRYAAPPVLALVDFEGDLATVYLESAQRAVTPGQSCVMYNGDVVFAGGFIDEAFCD